MKSVTAKLNYLKIAPRKVRLMANSLKGLSVSEAEAQLLTSSKRARLPIIKLLRSAVANAKNNSQMNLSQLFIKEIRIDQGPMLKRHMPRAMGRATPIQKKSSHITLILAESEKLKSPRFKIVKPKKVSGKIKTEKLKKEKETKIEKPKAPEKETKEAAKPTTKQGFIKRMFRRKTI